MQSNAAYFTIIVLARVITRLGALAEVDTRVVEQLFAADLEHLRRLYDEINALEEPETAAAAPSAVNGAGFPHRSAIGAPAHLSA